MASSRNFCMDIIFNILLLLCVKSLLRFKSVCKSWQTLITNSIFIKSHIKRSVETNSNCSLISTFFSLEKNYLHHSHGFHEVSHATKLEMPSSSTPFSNSWSIVGSCNGLICFYNEVKKFALCNPSTRLFRLIPNDPVSIMYPGSRFNLTQSYGFGYDYRSDDYKIVRSLEANFMVYSLKTDSWKILSYGPKILDEDYYDMLVNNRLHWPVKHQIFSFDLHDEEWRVFHLPNINTIEEIEQFHSILLAVLDERLCASLSMSLDHGAPNTDIWVMKDYGVEHSWIKVYSFSCLEVIPLGRSKDGCEILFSMILDRDLFFWDSQLQRTKMVEIPPKKYYDVIKCIESLAPLMGNCDVLKDKNKREKSVKRRRITGTEHTRISN